jgi:phosphate:Na+ symporter
MLKKILLPTILLILAYGFWISPNFKAIAAGVAIFLFGMLSLEEGFRAFTGGALDRLLKRATSSTGRSVLFGIVSTSVMQSSSLVSVIAISFLSAGLLTLAAGIGIIFGANLGTTTGAWLIAGFGLKVNIAAYAMPLLVFGVILIFQPSKALKGVGYIFAGLGFLFLGIHYMKEGFETFKETINLAEYAVAGYPGVLLFTAIGIFATVVMQSSHATLVLTITALAAGQITYENALALAIGANVGTTITAILGAMSANEGGKRLALAHLVFNMVTGVIAIAFIYQLVDVVNGASAMVGIADDDYTLKLAVFHSIFNLLGIAVMLPLLNTLVVWLEKVIPEKKPEVDQPMYLSESSAEFPGTAAQAVRLETERVFQAALRIVIDGLGMNKEQVLSDADLEQALAAQKRIHQFNIDAMYERHIKGIYSGIVAFISHTQFSRSDEPSTDLQLLREANTHLVEAVKDTEQMQENLTRYIGSENEVMRGAYNRLRLQIGLIIRDLEEMRAAGGGIVDLSSLDALKLVTDEDRRHNQEALGRLIGESAVTPEMGSSLINDSVFAHHIARNLIEAAQTLFATGERELAEAIQDVSLDESELAQISKRTGT